jgi:hypothetical protein
MKKKTTLKSLILHNPKVHRPSHDYFVLINIIFLKLIYNPHIFLDIHSFLIEPQFRYLKAHLALSLSNLFLTGVIHTEALFIFQSSHRLQSVIGK